MKVISIIQPWATLIMLGEKRFETRSWATKYRGELGIHASKKMNRFIRSICNQEPFKSVLAKYGFTADNLPLGAIVATSHLTNCHTIHSDHTGDAALLKPNGAPVYWLGKDSNEFLYGDYSHGRFAWELSDVKQIESIPAKGQLGLWNYKEGEK
jgi:activating signal cointegrator 1